MINIFLTYIDEEENKRLFEDIYYSYRKQMFVMANSILKNTDDAEDAVSTVFLKIAAKNWDIVNSINNKTDLRNYLLKATKNTSLNMIKVNQKRSFIYDDEFNSSLYNLTNDISDESFINTICDKIDYDEIKYTLRKLNEKYRYVLYYHFVLGLTVKQTALSLNQTISATKKQITRGKKILIDLIQKGGK